MYYFYRNIFRKDIESGYLMQEKIGYKYVGNVCSICRLGTMCVTLL